LQIKQIGGKRQLNLKPAGGQPQMGHKAGGFCYIDQK
jgi:hypothetical protein